ncbi:DUF1328 family protein [Halobellus captivus]|uniref:DUF1328 family protein n=1 Tax=Halobellus captivus TaxID=2592614 RepID=UPI0011A8C74D|nr:DUF1328 family protein [Halobellus captivus]
MSVTAATTLTGDLLAQTSLQLFSGEFLELALVFFVLAILAALLGARGVAGITMEIAKWFVILFIVLTIVSILL